MYPLMLNCKEIDLFFSIKVVNYKNIQWKIDYEIFLYIYKIIYIRELVENVVRLEKVQSVSGVQL